MNEQPSIWRSRQFWTAIIGGAVTLILYFVGKYAFSELEDVQMILNFALILIGALLAAYTVDDVSKTNARARVREEELRLAQLQSQVRLAELGAAVRTGTFSGSGNDS